MFKDNAIFSTSESRQLIDWFRQEAIVYPWGENPTLYRVWISEIMLQQTIVTAVVSFFIRWMNVFPDIKTLAASDEQTVVRCWEGLGYYSRARNIYKAARIIVDKYNGSVPESYDELVSLPGVGDYTACAILSIAKGEKLPVLDANVKRILCRLDARSRWLPKMAENDKSLLGNSFYSRNPGEFNAALMQFGQIICRKKNPQCTRCFLKKRCGAFKSGSPELFPEAVKKKITEIKTNLALFLNKKEELFCILPKSGIGAGLWKFPRLDSELSKNNPVPPVLLKERNHNYTRYRDRLIPFLFKVSDNFQPAVEGKWISLANIDDYPFPAVYRKIIEELKILRSKKQ